MRRKSDSSRKRIPATVAGRSFSQILDEVERGRTFVVHRHGKDVCTMAPVAATGRKLSECLAILLERPAVRLDDKFSGDLADILRGERKDHRPWG